jgi:hypothetical protein
MPGQQLARFREQAARCGGTGVAGALYCSFRSRSITMRAVRLSRARDSLTESGSVRIESARSGSWVGSAAADCAKSSMLMRVSAVEKVRSACSTAGITTLLSSEN